MNYRRHRESRNFFVQCSADSGYFLFPHQACKPDSLNLPPYCQCNGHPTSGYVKWHALSDHPETFQTGDKVVLYQSGNPNWLRGFWGYGVIKKSGERVAIKCDALLESPLILDDPTRRSIRAPFLKSIIRTKKPGTFRGTYAGIGDDDFDALKRAIDDHHKVRPSGARRVRPPSIYSKRASEAFKIWAKRGGWEVFAAGYPDLLAEFPNRRIAAFEAKLADDLRPAQEAMFEILRRIGLRISVLRHTRNDFAAHQIRQHRWNVIARDIGPITRGWPDFVLRKGKKVVAVELKTGWDELVSGMQIATLSSLSLQLGLEVHIVRAVRDAGYWDLYDDTERWLLYPPKRTRS